MGWCMMKSQYFKISSWFQVKNEDDNDNDDVDDDDNDDDDDGDSRIESIKTMSIGRC